VIAISSVSANTVKSHVRSIFAQCPYRPVSATTRPDRMASVSAW
jgi:hypothetical protein